MGNFDVRFTGNRETDVKNLARREKISISDATKKLTERFGGHGGNSVFANCSSTASGCGYSSSNNCSTSSCGKTEPKEPLNMGKLRQNGPKPGSR